MDIVVYTHHAVVDVQLPVKSNGPFEYGMSSIWMPVAK